MLAKAIYKFNTIPIKTPISFFTGGKKKTILKFTWNLKRPLIVKTILNKENNARKIPDIKFIVQGHGNKNNAVRA